MTCPTFVEVLSNSKQHVQKCNTEGKLACFSLCSKCSIPKRRRFFQAENFISQRVKYGVNLWVTVTLWRPFFLMKTI